MSDDFAGRHGLNTADSMDKLLEALDELYDQGWRVTWQDVLRITNGTTDLELWHDSDTGWYFDEEDA